MGCKSKYIKSQIDYGWFKSKRTRKKGTHIIRQKQKRQLQKELKDINERFSYIEKSFLI